MDGLPQAHLVSQDGVGALRPGEPQPVQPLQLIGVQGAPSLSDAGRLLLILSDGLGRKNLFTLNHIKYGINTSD